MNKTRSLLLFSLSLLILSFNSWGRNCDNQSGARHFNPNDEVGNPTGGFVASTAKVDAGVYLGPNVEVCDRAIISVVGSDTPRIEDEVKVYGRAKISGNVIIKDQVEVFGGAKLEASGINHILVREKAKIYGYAKLSNNARVQGNAIIAGAVKIEANGRVCKDHKLERAEYVFNRFDFCPIPIAEINIDDESNLFGPDIAINANAEVLGQNSLSMTYIWDFGDFGFSRSQNGVDAEHIYRATGEYSITLKVFDKNGEFDFCEKLIKIKELIDKPPYPSIKQDFYSTNKNSLHVKFDASQSVDEDGYVVSYEWDFGNGETSEEIQPEVLFSGPGIYYPKLIVTDDHGNASLIDTIVQVNCAIDEGDNTCPYFLGHTDKILPLTKELLEIKFGQDKFLLPQSIDKIEAKLRNDRTSIEFDIKSALEIQNGRLYLQKSELVKILSDFENSYTFTISLFSDGGDFYSGRIENIRFGTSKIIGKTTGRAGSIILIEHVDLPIQISTKVRNDATFELIDLPSGHYNVYLDDHGGLSTSESFYLPSYSAANIFLQPVDETQDIEASNQVIISEITPFEKLHISQFFNKAIPVKRFHNINNRSNSKLIKKLISKLKSNDIDFIPEKIVYTSQSGGASKEVIRKSIPTSAKKVIVTYQLYAFEKMRNDSFSLRIYGVKGLNKTINLPFDKIDERAKFDRVLVGDKFIASNWYQESVDLPEGSEGKVKVSIVASKNLSSNNADDFECTTAIGASLQFDNQMTSNKPFVDAKNLKRIDDNGVAERRFFPTHVAPTTYTEVNSATKKPLKNPFYKFKDRGWFLEFIVPIILPKDYETKDVLVSLANLDNNLETNLFEIDESNGIARTNRLYSVVDKSKIFNGEQIVDTKIVRIPISSIEENVSWLKFDLKRVVDSVEFRFKAITKSKGVDEITESGPMVPLIPLYDAVDNPLIKCDKYGLGNLSMYGTYHTLMSLRDVTLDPLFSGKNSHRLKCNDISLPFGGVFTGFHDSHKKGVDIDFLYPTIKPFSEINFSPEYRAMIVGFAGLKSIPEVIRNLAEKSLQEWVNSAREGINAMFNQFGANLEKIFVSSGFSKEDKSDWHLNLLIHGKILTTGGKDLPLKLSQEFISGVVSKLEDAPNHINHIHFRAKE